MYKPTVFTTLGRLSCFAMLAGLAVPTLATAAIPPNVRLVRDIHPGVASANIGETFAFGEILLFTADDGVHGWELWRSDGTEAGTVLVKDISPGTTGSYAVDFAALGGAVLFAADDGVHGRELWRTDGTEAGTTLVKDINPGALDGVAFGNRFVSMGGAVYFVGYQPATGSELWRSDGTDGGTQLVKDIYPGPGPTENCGPCPECGHRTPRGLAVMGGALYFAAADSGECWTGVYDTELWRSTGKETETWRVRDIEPNGWGSIPRNLTTVGGTLYFWAVYALYRSDGTESGTFPVPAAPQPSELVAASSRLYFTARSLSFDLELWRTAPGDPGATLVRTIAPSQLFCGGHLFAQGNNLLLEGADPARGCELWTSDGTGPGTSLLSDVFPGPDSSPPNYFANAPTGVTYFTAADGVSAGTDERELWRTDGTAQGTRLVADLRPGLQGSDPYPGVVAGRYLFFAADDGASGRELWAVDLDVLFVDGFDGP